MAHSFAKLISMCLLLLSGCATEAMDQLLDHAGEGIELAKQNNQAMADLLEQRLAADRARIHQAFNSDVDYVSQVETPHSEGLTADWVKEAGQAYGLLLENNFEQRLKLMQMRDMSNQNLEMVGRLVQKGRDLNQAMLTQEQRVKMLIDRYNNDTPSKNNQE